MESSVKPVKISDDEKIEAAEKFKAEGNDLYKSKNFKQAIGKYHRAIIQLKAVGQNRNVGSIMGLSGQQTECSPEIRERTNALTRDCYNNLAACMLQQEDPKYEKIIEHCNHVLEVSDNNVKALYRKGVALYHLNNYEDALQCLQQSIQNSDTGNQVDPSTRKYLKLCKEGLAAQEKELKTAYQKMFRQPDKT